MHNVYLCKWGVIVGIDYKIRKGTMREGNTGTQVYRWWDSGTQVSSRQKGGFVMGENHKVL